MGFIYLLTGPSGKHYVGQTVNTVAKRWQSHQRDLQRFTQGRQGGCTCLLRALAKYSVAAFTCTTILECPDSELDVHERYYIIHYKSKAPHGYNLTDGGALGYRHNEETKQILRTLQLGRKRDERARNNISTARTGLVQKRGKTRVNAAAASLPKYIELTITKNPNGALKEGYRVRVNKKIKSFLSMKLSMSQKLKIAIEYLENQTAKM